MADLHLGLIGDNISRSSAHRLHRLAGQQNGLDVRYDRLIPIDLGVPFDQVFLDCAAGNFRGLNITYPYKEQAILKVTVEDEQVRRIGAINTVVFSDRGPLGFNTDYSGFIEAYRTVRRDKAPGIVAQIGAGGVGRAVAFGLLTLGVRELRIADRDPDKALSLAKELRRAASDTEIVTAATVEEIAPGANGLINGTPVGMIGYPGTPIPGWLVAQAEWAFDAVYTPVDTQFLNEATRAGLEVISGYELFFYQGVNAWTFFSGMPLDLARLRSDLMAGKGGD
ncbi:shikimate dehydrogenase family protein [Paracoccus sp. (in: a-proteobacteria)]|uniref:shikimate dehydrogenase family protein n=1 Tax=Paracoccus sp. TaxID=267 RepID=UPI003A8A7A29